MTAPISDIEILRRRMGEDAFSISIVPPADSYLGKPIFGVSDWGIGIIRDSAYREEAEAFVSFLIKKSPLLAEKARGIPGHNVSPEFSVLRSQEANPFDSKVRELYISGDFASEFLDEAEYASGMSETERETIFREEMLDLFNGVHTPSSAATAIREKWGL